MNLLERIRKLSERKRKIILWIAIIVFGALLLFFYINNIQKRLKGFQPGSLKKDLKIDELKNEFNKLPDVKLPNAKELEEIIQEATNTNQ